MMPMLHGGISLHFKGTTCHMWRALAWFGQPASCPVQADLLAKTIHQTRRGKELQAWLLSDPASMESHD